jgi:peptidoglycan/LPS O-acetylase OafA/YrhL
MIASNEHLSTQDGIWHRLWRLVAGLPERIGRPTTRTTYIAQIDGLRFLAIASVLVWHISLRADRFVDAANRAGAQIPELYCWFAHGEVGVALFFFISGFVIAQPFLSKQPAQWQIGQFYWRRVRRIYPPYLIVLTICLLLVLASRFGVANNHVTPLHSYLASLFYLNGVVYDQSSLLDPPIWSLDIEAQFYLITPLLLALYARIGHPGARLLTGAAVVLGLIAAASLVDHLQPFDGRFRFGLLAHVYLFAAGIVVADIARLSATPQRPARGAFDLLFFGGIAACYGLGLWLTSVNARPGGGWADAMSDLLVLASVLAIYVGAMRGRIGRAMMTHPWIRLIGTMCFSIYLVHVVVIQAFDTVLLHHLPLHDALAIYGTYGLVLVPVTLAASLLFYVGVERPFMTGALLRLPALGREARARRAS